MRQTGEHHGHDRFYIRHSPSSLVEQARQAAQPIRRSVASQTEYRATLGQMVEHAAPASADTLATRPLAAQTQDTRAQRVRDVARANRGQTQT